MRAAFKCKCLSTTTKPLVRKSCFGMDLIPTYREDIEEYKAAYQLTGMNVTTKAHVIFEHIADFCADQNKGLGHFSAQAG